MVGTLFQDIRYGARMLWKSPGFTVVAIFTLALGIGANSAIFSVVNAVLLRPLPFKNPGALVKVNGELRKQGVDKEPLSYPDFVDLKAQVQSLEHVTAYNQASGALTGEGEPERLRGVNVSAELFPLLGVEPVVGRAFAAEDDRPESAPVVLLGHGLWQRRFGADPKVVGREIMLNGRSTTVLGIMPPDFNFPVQGLPRDYWSPLAPSVGKRATERGSHYLNVIGRLKQGFTLAQSAAETQSIAARLAGQYPETNTSFGINVDSAHEEIVRDVKPALLVLLGAVGFVLLIACANVANLLLARATARTKEIAIRTALGASRLRVLRQLLTESVLLSLVGGSLGLLIAVWGVDLLMSVSPADIPRVKEIGLDARALGFTLAVSVVTGLIFGLAPALQASKLDLNETLKEGGRGSTEGLRRNRVRSLLVISEIALSLVLLVSAGLLTKSFMRLLNVNPGFNPDNVLTVGVALPPAKYTEEAQQSAFFRETLERLKNSPGIVSAAAVFPLPLSGSNRINTFQIAGRPVPAHGEEPEAHDRVTTPDYFQAMGIPVIKGRVFTERDGADAPPVIVVNESFARRFFPDEDPLGKRIIMDAEQNPKGNEIVGVVGDVRHRALDAEGGAELYFSYLQMPERSMALVIRAQAVDPMSVASSIRGVVQQVDKDQPLSNIQTMNQLLADSVARRRFNMLLLGIFSAVALLLAAVGIFGVMNYSVSQRTHEIGIRMALGAQAGDVLRMVVGQGMILALIGVAAGLIAAFALTRVMSNLLFGVSATDPLTFVGVSLLLAAIALVACYIPARRATKVDPMVALRYE
ncbi:MAG: ABC transporter permease [Pyrinomonadaceae bacterium]